MSLQPQEISDVPEETARIARAAFPKGTLCLRLRDELGIIFTDEHFTDLYPTRGQPAETPWRLAAVTILQFLEGLSDRQAAQAVRSRIDWKYLLGLELTDPGFDWSSYVNSVCDWSLAEQRWVYWKHWCISVSNAGGSRHVGNNGPTPRMSSPRHGCY